MRFSILALGATLLGLASAQGLNSTCSITAPSCPACAGQDFTSPMNNQYDILCPGVNARRSLPHVSPALKRQSGATFAQCIATCDIITGCQSVLYDPLTTACAAFTCLVTPTGTLWGAEKVLTATGQTLTPTACPANVAPSTNININVNVNVNGAGSASVGVYVATVGYGGVSVNVVVTTGTPIGSLCMPGSGATVGPWNGPGSNNSTMHGGPGGWGQGGSGGSGSGSWGPSSGSWGSGSGGGPSGSATWVPAQSNDASIAEAASYMFGFAALISFVAL